MVYLLIFILLIWGFFYHDIYNVQKGKRYFYWIVVGFLWAISAFSYRLGSDTINYMYEFSYETKTLFDLTSNDLFGDIDRQPGWILLMSFSKTLSSSFTFFKIIYAAFLNFAVARFIYRNCACKFTILLLYFSFTYFTLNFEVLREGLAISFFLFAVKYFFSKEWLKFYLLILVSISFHISAIPLLLLPILGIIRDSRFKIVVTFFLCIIIIILTDRVQGVFYNLLMLEAISGKALTYFSSDTYGTSIVSISNIVNYILNILIPLIVLDRAIKMKDEICKYSSMIIAYVLIYSLSLQLPIFYRFNNYFNLFYIIVYVGFFNFRFLFNSLSVRSKKIIGIIGVFAFCTLKLSVMKTPVEGIPSYVRYYPYSSVFTKEIDKTREALYLRLGF